MSVDERVCQTDSVPHQSPTYRPTGGIKHSCRSSVSTARGWTEVELNRRLGNVRYVRGVGRGHEGVTRTHSSVVRAASGAQ